MVDNTDFSKTVSVLVIREVKDSGGPRDVGLLTQLQPENIFFEFSLRGSFKLCIDISSSEAQA